MLTRGTLPSLPEVQTSRTLAEIQAAAEPVSPRVAALLAPTRTVPRSGDHGFEGLTEIWEPRQVSPADIPILLRQLDQLQDALQPADGGACLARIFGLLAHYRQTELPPEVDRCVANDFLEDLGEYPLCVIETACRSWRRDPARFKYRPLPGDLRKLCAEMTERVTTTANRIKKLLAIAERQQPPAGHSANPPLALDSISQCPLPARPNDIRSRVIALAAAKRMPT